MSMSFLPATILRRSIQLLALVAALPITAQEESSTLLGLVDRADAIVEARVVALPMPGADLHRVLFAVQRAHKGTPPDRFELSEPAMVGCGRALTGLVPGVSLLMFLHQKDGEVTLVTSSARALPVKDPLLLQHVLALVRTTDMASRARILAASLRSEHNRIRLDAALSLATLPGLEGADTTVRSQIGAVVEQLLLERDPALPALLRAAQRVGTTAVIDPLLTHVLTGQDPALQRLMLDRLADFDSELVATRLAARMPVDSAGRHQALLVLERLPLNAARPLLLTLYQDPSRLLGTAAGTTLLLLGGTASELPPATDDRKDLILSTPAVRPPRFRSIRPHKAPTGTVR